MGKGWIQVLDGGRTTDDPQRIHLSWVWPKELRYGSPNHSLVKFSQYRCLRFLLAAWILILPTFFILYSNILVREKVMERNYTSIPLGTVRNSKHRFAMTTRHKDVNDRRKAHKVGRLYSPSGAKSSMGPKAPKSLHKNWRYTDGNSAYPQNYPQPSFWFCCSIPFCLWSRNSL